MPGPPNPILHLSYQVKSKGVRCSSLRSILGKRWARFEPNVILKIIKISRVHKLLTVKPPFDRHLTRRVFDSWKLKTWRNLVGLLAVTGLESCSSTADPYSYSPENIQGKWTQPTRLHLIWITPLHCTTVKWITNATAWLLGGELQGTLSVLFLPST